MSNTEQEMAEALHRTFRTFASDGVSVITKKVHPDFIPRHEANGQGKPRVPRVPRKSFRIVSSWTDEDTAKMLELRSKGHTWREIAHEMQRSEKGCRERYYLKTGKRK